MRKKTIVLLLTLITICMPSSAKAEGVVCAIYSSVSNVLRFTVVSETNYYKLLSDPTNYIWKGDMVLKSDLHLTDSGLPLWCQSVAKNADAVFIDESFSEVVPRTTSNWFRSMTNLQSIIGLENLNTSTTTDMSGMFFGCSSLWNLNTSKMQTGNVRDMSGMFYGCSSLKNLDLSSFNVNSVTSMSNMFSNCNSLTSLNLSSFITTNVTDMGDMFFNCGSLSALDISGFNTSRVTDMSNMFCGCASLKALDLSRLNTSKVADMSNMFKGCASIIGLDLTSFDFSNVTTMCAMFEECVSLARVDFGTSTTTSLADASYMFRNCSLLISVALVSFDVSKMENTSWMFAGCGKLKTIVCDDSWSCKYSTNMFKDCESLVGAIPYSSAKTDVAYANPLYGYFTHFSKYDLWICGQQITTANCYDLSNINGVTVNNNGYLRYEPASNTLEMCDAHILCLDAPAIHNAVESLTLSVEGTVPSSLICHGNPALFIDRPTILKGAKLSIQGNPGYYSISGNGIYMSNSLARLTVSDGNLDVESQYCIVGKSYTYVTERGTTEVDYYGYLEVTGQSTVHCSGSVYDIGPIRRLVLGDNVAITEPQGAFFKKPYVYSGENPSGKGGGVTIQSLSPQSPAEDVNNDGAVNISDVVAVIHTIAGDKKYIDRADVNSDHSVNITDIVDIINYIVSH